MTTLILLNLLIAIMGDTFDRVQETYAANTSKELCTLMVENEVFVRRGFIFKNQKYIIVINEEKAEEGEESWEGKMKSIRKFMEATVGVQDRALEDSLEEIEKKARIRMIESTARVEESVFRRVDMIEKKLNALEVITNKGGKSWF